jgi:spermidine/putrescine transport system permease protein
VTSRRLLAAVYWTAATALALPLVLVAMTSLSRGIIVGFPVELPSLRWYVAALTDRAYERAFALSALLACSSAALALVAGTWIALAIASLRHRWMRLALIAGALVPLVSPGIVHAIALRIAVQTVGLDPGMLAMLLGHVIHATPYAVIMVGARLAILPSDLVDAARDLGAGSVASFWHVTVAWIRPALLGAGALAALTSFDDFIRSFFLDGYDPTLPVLLYGRLHSGLTPEINAIATMVLLAACGAGWISDRVARARLARTVWPS